MSGIFKKTMFAMSSLLILVVISACAKPLSRDGANNGYYNQSYYQNGQLVSANFYGYGQENLNAGAEQWGPICPIDGSDLSGMVDGEDIAISTPNIKRGNNPCFPPPPHLMAQSQQVTYSQPQGGYSQPMQQPVNGAEIPVRGVIGGANQNGYIMLDCQGEFISNGNKGCVKSVNIPVNNEPKREIIQTNNSNGAINDWIAAEGSSLRSLLEEWGEKSGWRVVWNSDREYIVEAGAVFRGEFMDIASALIRAFARANPAPQGTFYKGNKVLVINTQEAENAE